MKTKPSFRLCDFHVHTTFSDGAHSPAEVARAAYEMGVEALGFSTHSYTHFDESYCIMPNRIDAYFDEINRLKQAYDGKMVILAGVEQDYYSTYPADRFDYVIGSVHYLCVNGKYYAIDHRRDLLLEATEEAFGGDVYALIEEYYRVVGDVAEKLHPDIIGHFDVITKFNEKTPFFDETHPRYLAARQAALDKLLLSGVAFEVNTGAMSRGYKTCPYPMPDVLSYLRQHRGEVLLSSDSHARGTVTHAFEEVYPALVRLGFDPSATCHRILAHILKNK